MRTYTPACMHARTPGQMARTDGTQEMDAASPLCGAQVVHEIDCHTVTRTDLEVAAA